MREIDDDWCAGAPPRSRVKVERWAFGIPRWIARGLVRALPTDVGLWRLKQFLPGAPPTVAPVVTRLRGMDLRLKYKPSTYSGWYLYYRGMYGEQNVRLCLRLLRAGMTFVDVGANCGLYSVIASRAVGPTGRVIAVEPQPDLSSVILDNAALNRQKNITVRTCAVGATRTHALLYRPSRTNDGAATLQLDETDRSFGCPIPVVVNTLSDVLDSAAISNVGAIKIDVEGAELDVLEVDPKNWAR